ncbi:MAG TPA: hypothetical protein VM492_15310 [Sumerlaeia bacterium]|nr:hypothetical protein [Sumerlaeia bacterium]
MNSGQSPPSFLRPALAVLCPALLFLVGLEKLIMQVLHRVGPHSWLTWAENQLDLIPPISLWAGWALVMVVPFFLLVLTLQQRSSRKLLVLKTGSGHSLRIREGAVNRYVRDRLVKQPFIKAVRVRSRARGGALAVSARIWIALEERLDNLQEKVRTQIVEDCLRGFGVEQVHDPDLQFESVKDAPTGRERPARHAPSRSESDSSSRPGSRQSLLAGDLGSPDAASAAGTEGFAPSSGPSRSSGKPRKADAPSAQGEAAARNDAASEGRRGNDDVGGRLGG